MTGTSNRRRGLATASRSLGCALATAALLATTRAHADPSPADRARAADLFKKSAELYRKGEFKQAIERLDEAYALDPQPVLVYNRARAEEGLGQVDAAISDYEKYLAQEPNTPDRGAIEQRLQTIRRQRDERAELEKDRDARAKEPSPAPAPATEPAQPSDRNASLAPASRRPSVVPWILGGAGVAGIGAGAVLGVLALGAKDDAVAEPVQQRSIERKEDADGLATGSTVAFVVGGVLLVAGAVWWFVERRGASASRTAMRQGWVLP